MPIETNIDNIVNNYFDQVYVISMEKNKERHSYINDLLNKMNIKFVYKFGPEGENINTKEYFDNKLITDRMLNMPNPIGTILTHKMAWDDMILNNYQKCLILEDDVYFFSEFKSYLNDCINNKDFNNWDVFQLGWLPPSYFNSEDKIINKYLRIKWSSVGGAHCYAITNNTASILINNLYPINKAVDGYIGDMTNYWTKKEKNIYLNCYSPNKCLAIDCSHNNGNTIKFESHGI